MAVTAERQSNRTGSGHPTEHGVCGRSKQGKRPWDGGEPRECKEGEQGDVARGEQPPAAPWALIQSGREEPPAAVVAAPRQTRWLVRVRVARDDAARERASDLKAVPCSPEAVGAASACPSACP